MVVPERGQALIIIGSSVKCFASIFLPSLITAEFSNFLNVFNLVTHFFKINPASDSDAPGDRLTTNDKSQPRSDTPLSGYRRQTGLTPLKRGIRSFVG